MCGRAKRCSLAVPAPPTAPGNRTPHELFGSIEGSGTRVPAAPCSLLASLLNSSFSSSPLMTSRSVLSCSNWSASRVGSPEANSMMHEELPMLSTAVANGILAARVLAEA